MKPTRTLIRNTRCRDVLVVDQDALFKAEERKCRREQARLDSLRRELEEYEQLDQPAFVSWLYTTFALELTTLREQRAVLTRAFSVLHAVEREVEARGTSYDRAFERVAKRQAPPPVFENNFENRPERDAPSPPKAKPASGSIKECYRELVRKLHPDLNSNLTTQQRELWHEVQQAYHDRDLPRLEQLATMAGVLDESPARLASLSDLRKVLRTLRQATGELTRALREAKQEPEWHFREALKSPARLQRLHTLMAVEIANDLGEVETGITELEGLFAGWHQERAAANHHPRKVRPGKHRPGKQRSRGRGRG
ncbi:MAG: J domain-containing protein [Deltaproteobacteria bacterium]|nr:J domain-containing protein [Deltaproteobacteria bacterium]